MEYVQLGNLGKVSKICLGCMSFGKKGTMHDWTLSEEETFQVVQHALELGINFFDTANCYSNGTSEIYLGNALKKLVKREDVFIASKVYFNEGRLSKEAILREIEGTLSRLQTSYLDLYIIHRFDYETPIEETMEALDLLVKQGKVRAIGASAMYASQFKEMQKIAREKHLTPFLAMENHYNLIYREDEKELILYGKKNGIFFMPYSPLAGGHLARRTWESDTLRGKTDKVVHGKYDALKEEDMQIVLKVDELARLHNVKMSEIALAWLWAKGMDSPIIGATKLTHIDDAIHALQVHLSKEEIQALDALYVAHPIVGALQKNPPQGTILLDKKKD